MRKAMIAIGLIVLVVVGIMVTSMPVAAKGGYGGGGGRPSVSR
jgi:hypothetical protein